MGDVPCQKNGSGSSGGMTDGAIRTIRLRGNEIVLCWSQRSFVSESKTPYS
jgi:hypothetical protein